jgi:protein TonB
MDQAQQMTPNSSMRTKLEGFFNTLAPPMPRARTWSLVWPGSSMGLSNATLLSLAFHLSLLALTFSSLPAKERVLNDNSLQIVLINTKTREIVNDKPQALAQSTLQGGGDLINNTLASSLVMKSETHQMGSDHWDANEKLEQLKQEQSQLLTQLREQLSQTPSLKELVLEPRQEFKRQALLKWLAQIDQRIQEQNARPRKRYLSPSTKEVAYAQYYQDVKQRVENTGTQFFPTINGKKLYGTLTMLMTINAKGEVVQSEVLKSSGSQELDRRAIAIVQKSQPFEPFNTELLKKADLLGVVSLFQFTREGLVSQQFLEE